MAEMVASARVPIRGGMTEAPYHASSCVASICSAGQSKLKPQADSGEPRSRERGPARQAQPAIVKPCGPVDTGMREMRLGYKGVESCFLSDVALHGRENVTESKPASQARKPAGEGRQSQPVGVEKRGDPRRETPPLSVVGQTRGVIQAQTTGPCTILSARKGPGRVSPTGGFRQGLDEPGDDEERRIDPQVREKQRAQSSCPTMKNCIIF
ncbi:hypothetical protein TgHK011_009881 [Trichoderma gracile]|nr:hypothetical protein TgHK011_009881 [Trichoderma gracile]